MTASNGQSGAQRGFTLVELLVVVAIMAVLMSILVPALVNAKALVRRVSCLSNLNAMSKAAHMYLVESTAYPMALIFPQPNSEYKSIAWDFRIRRDGTAEPGMLWPGSQSMRIQQCPSFDGAANWGDDPYTGYNYNVSYIGRIAGESIVPPAKPENILRPAETALFGDGGFSGGANKFMRAPFRSAGDISFNGRYAGTQAYRHLGTTGVAFCDGHAEAWAKRYTETEPASHSSMIAEDTGFLSPDNSAYDLE